jgi:Fic family protein
MKSRTFERTHPWITFKADLSRAEINLWMLLGEARSKCEHLAGIPLRPDVAARLYQIYLSKGIHATTSIEGNTLTEDEVMKRVEGRLPLPKSREYLGREVDNIAKACNEIVRMIFAGATIPLTADNICHFNRNVLQGLSVGDGVVPGEFRTFSVGVANYRGAPAEDCPYLLDRMCEWLNGEGFRGGDPDKTFMFAFLKAVLAHLYIAWIHPFGDGNGRTARLVEFQLLVQSGLLPLPAAHLLSNHYNKTRTRYYQELDRASRSGGEILPFIIYAAEGFVDGLREQLAFVRQQQLDVTWENYVHDHFRGFDGIVERRRKHLVLDMPDGVWVPRNEVAKISPRVAKEFARKSEKTVSRDLEALVESGLLLRKDGRYKAARETILAFLPPTCPPPANAVDDRGKSKAAGPRTKRERTEKN